MGNLPGVKAEIKLDATETLQNVYKDTLQEPLKSSSNALATTIDFFNNTVLYPMQKYNIKAKFKLEAYAEELKNKSKERTPDENLIEPKINILGPTLDGLKYNLDEDYIREMFTNILLANMDNRTQDKIMPSYINIVKELSQNDARFLKKFKDYNTNRFYSIKIVAKKDNSLGSTELSKYICTSYSKKDNIVSLGGCRLDDFVIDNLVRLNILKIDYSNFYSDAPEKYEQLFKQYSPDFPEGCGYKADYKKGYVELTTFGKNFIDICLS